MQEQVGSAIVGEVVSRATSFLTGKCNEHKSIDERIEHLEMLIIKISSAVEVSEAFDVNIEPLHDWQMKLKEAVSEADETLYKFKNRTLHEKLNRTFERGSSSSDDLMEGEAATCQKADIEAKLRLASTLKHLFCRILGFMHHKTESPWPAILERLAAFARVLDPRTFSLLNPQMTVTKYLENDEKVNKLIKSVEKLEKMAGDIGVFVELIKLQSKRKMTRKRKRSARPHLSFFFILSLKLPIQDLLLYSEFPRLLLINELSPGMKFFNPFLLF